MSFAALDASGSRSFTAATRAAGAPRHRAQLGSWQALLGPRFDRV